MAIAARDQAASPKWGSVHIPGSSRIKVGEFGGGQKTKQRFEVGLE